MPALDIISACDLLGHVAQFRTAAQAVYGPLRISPIFARVRWKSRATNVTMIESYMYSARHRVGTTYSGDWKRSAGI